LNGFDALTLSTFVPSELNSISLFSFTGAYLVPGAYLVTGAYHSISLFSITGAYLVTGAYLSGYL
jgi:hypothetical protein